MDDINYLKDIAGKSFRNILHTGNQMAQSPLGQLVQGKNPLPALKEEITKGTIGGQPYKPQVQYIGEAGGGDLAKPGVAEAGLYDTGKFNFSKNIGANLTTGEPIMQNGKVVGGIKLDTSGYGYPKGMGKIEGIEINPEARGQGLGKDAIANAFKNNPDITAFRGNATKESVGFWKKLGAKFDNPNQPSLFTIEKSRVAQPTIGGVKK